MARRMELIPARRVLRSLPGGQGGEGNLAWAAGCGGCAAGGRRGVVCPHYRQGSRGPGKLANAVCLSVCPYALPALVTAAIHGTANLLRGARAAAARRSSQQRRAGIRTEERRRGTDREATAQRIQETDRPPATRRRMRRPRTAFPPPLAPPPFASGPHRVTTDQAD